MKIARTESDWRRVAGNPSRRTRNDYHDSANPRNACTRQPTQRNPSTTPQSPPNRLRAIQRAKSQSRSCSRTAGKRILNPLHGPQTRLHPLATWTRPSSNTYWLNPFVVSSIRIFHHDEREICRYCPLVVSRVQFFHLDEREI